MTAESAEFRLPKERRLSKHEDFRAVFARKCSAADATIVVYAKRNDVGYSRLGLSVSRKHGSAVRRNYWKRLLREAFRREYPELPVGVDWVLIPRQGAEPQLVAIRASLSRLTAQLDKRLRGKERGS